MKRPKLARSTFILALCAAAPLAAQTRPQTSPQRVYTLGAPIVSVGRDDNVEGHDLFRVSSAKWSTDGTLLVANSGGFDVRVFDSTGKLKTSFGREGEGPGEFRALGWMWLGRGDTVITFDGALRRVTFWSHAGKRLKEENVSKEYTEIIGRMADGKYAEIRQVSQARPAENKWAVDTISIGLYDATAGKRDDIERYPSHTRFGARIPNGPVIQTPLPLFPKSIYAQGSDRIFAGYTGTPAIDVFSAQGRKLHQIKPTLQLAPLTAALHKAWADSVAGTLPVTRAEALGFVNSLRYPDVLPAYDMIIVDDAGNLWARQFLAPGARMGTWMIFDKAGRQTARMTMPASMSVMQVGSNFLVALTGGKDENEVVTVYRLLR